MAATAHTPEDARSGARPCLHEPFCTVSSLGACAFSGVCADFQPALVPCSECGHGTGRGAEGFVCRRVPRKPVPMPPERVLLGGGYSPSGREGGPAMTRRMYYGWPNPYDKDLRLAPRAALPEGVEHGTMAAVRFGCCCSLCLARKKRAQKRGWMR